MSNKSYLSRQYRLLGISSNELFTDEEAEQLNKIGEIGRKLDEKGLSKEERKIITAQKKEECAKLREMFSKYPANTPRKINVHKLYKDYDKFNHTISTYIKDNNEDMNIEYIISEFENEWSRCAGIEEGTFCHIKINLCWNEQHCDLLKQAFVNGIDLDAEIDGEIKHLHYNYFTASAGQMRTDRASFVEENAMKETWNQLFAGMTPEIINAHGGINLNKISAYIGLVTGASERWELEDGSYFDIDNVIVVPDIESYVTCELDHIDENYVPHRGEHTEKVNQCDGVGWVLPRLIEKSKVKSKNRMVRGPWIKGLVTQFDYIEFCKENNVEPVVVDFWKTPHNLVEENIMMVLTESQLKLAKYYDSWEQYKEMFHENNCYICATNYEEDDIDNSVINYQFLQTLLKINTDKEDDELARIINKDYEEIRQLGECPENQMAALGCEKKETTFFQKSVKAYPALLRDAFTRDQLVDIKESKLIDAKSGKLNLNNKRLYVVPDPYAAWERIALGIEQPKGLLRFGEIYTAEEYYMKKARSNKNKIDLLRSPHLYIEHCIRTLITNKILEKWFTTQAVYTSFDDIASRILQFDFDGDELNLLDNEDIINAAQRTIDHYKIVPLFYDAQKAGKQYFTPENRFESLMTAHKYGGAAIGGVSNTLTKLWSNGEDIKTASQICCMNNLIIDAAKTGKIIDYPEDVAKTVNKISKSKMPWFFQFTPNGRSEDKPAKHCLEKPEENSGYRIMNDIALRFCNLDSTIDSVRKKIPLKYIWNSNGKRLENFNPYMLLSGPIETTDIMLELYESIYKDFDKAMKKACKINSEIKRTRMRSFEDPSETAIKDNAWWDAEYIKMYNKLVEDYKDEELIYNAMVYWQFIKIRPGQKKTDYNSDFIGRKQQFWIIWGETAYNNIINNIKNCYKCKIRGCNMVVPNWEKDHELHHQIPDTMHKRCICGIVFEYYNYKDALDDKKEKSGKAQAQKFCPDCLKAGIREQKAKEAHDNDKKTLKERRAAHIEESRKAGLC